MYLNTFVESFKLALTSTLLICAIGYPFGYFMAKLSAQWKKRVMLLLMIPFWTSSLIRLYGWIIIFRANGTLDKLLMGGPYRIARSSCCTPTPPWWWAWYTRCFSS